MNNKLWKIRIFKIFVFVFILNSYFIIYASDALAVDYLPIVPCGRAGTPECNTCHFFQLTQNIFNFAIEGLLPALSFLFFIIAGALILLGGANQNLISRGRNMFRYTFYGILIILASYMIVTTILKSIVPGDLSTDWNKITCTTTVGVVQPLPTFKPGPLPSQVVVSKGNCTGVQCSDANLNICGENTNADCSLAAVNKFDARIKAGAGNKQVCSGIDTVKLIKAIISQESGGKTNLTASDGLSYGVLQLRPETANQFKSGCSRDNINAAWLKNEANIEASVCIAANYLKSLSSSCGCTIRNLAAGYNGGGAAKGACDLSQSCKSCSMCGNEPTRRWECLWDGPDGEHKVCNADRSGSSFNATRKYVPKVSYCYKKF